MKISTEVRMTASDGDERFSVEPADFVVAAVRDGTLESLRLVIAPTFDWLCFASGL
jgi:hypothetical protein